MIGQTLDDRYAILRLIGQGGMGAVYEARHTGTNRRVAVKVILHSSMDQSHVARFEREAKIVGAVDSQHITTVYDTGRDRATGAPYIAMELLDGDDANVLIERLGPLPVDLALRVVYQACLGLGRAHNAGIVHRDIKTANFFLHRREAGERIVKILDFGIAKATGPEVGDGSLTREGTMLGSPLYMSPEQAKGIATDARSDVWSMGIALYELLSGQRPNDHMQQIGELIVAICTQPAPWLQDVAPRVPFEVAALVRRALTIDPAGRFASANDMAAALKELLPGGQAIDEAMLKPLEEVDRISIAPRRAGAMTASGERAVSLGTSGVIVPGAGAGRRSSAPLVIGAILLVVVLGGAGAAFFLRGGGSAGDPGQASEPQARASETAASSAPVEAVPSASSSAAAALSAAPSVTPIVASVTASALSGTAAPLPSLKPVQTAGPRPTPSVKPTTTTKPASDDETSRK